MRLEIPERREDLRETRVLAGIRPWQASRSPTPIQLQKTTPPTYFQLLRAFQSHLTYRFTRLQ